MGIKWGIDNSTIKWDTLLSWRLMGEEKVGGMPGSTRLYPGREETGSASSSNTSVWVYNCCTNTILPITKRECCCSSIYSILIAYRGDILRWTHVGYSILSAATKGAQALQQLRIRRWAAFEKLTFWEMLRMAFRWSSTHVDFAWQENRHVCLCCSTLLFSDQAVRVLCAQCIFGCNCVLEQVCP